jgi:hypothetical protein
MRPLPNKALQLTPSRAVQPRVSLLASILGAFGELGGRLGAAERPIR